MTLKSKLDIFLILSIINFLFSFISGSVFLFLISLSGLFFYIYIHNKDNKFKCENKNAFIILSIANFLSSRFISGIISILIYNDLNNPDRLNNNENIPTKKKEKIDPQIKKIDVLLKLGILMVFIAGLVFATTGWYLLNSIIKIFIFIIISCLFIWLSKFSEKNIKIKSTIYLYWLLGMIFIIFGLFSAGHDGLFGNYFSLVGAGYLLYCSFLASVLSLTGIITYYNFKEKNFLYIVYSGVLLTLTFLLKHFNLTNDCILAILILVVTIFKFIKRKDDFNTLNYFSNILVVVLGIIFILSTFNANDLLPTSISSILLNFNLYKYLYLNKKSSLNKIASFLAYLLSFPSIILISNGSIDIFCILSVSVTTLMYFISLAFDEHNLMKSSLTTADIIILIFFLISLFAASWIPLFISIINGLICLICTLKDNLEDYEFEVGINPLKVSMLVFGLGYFLQLHHDFGSLLEYWMCTSLLLFIIIFYFCNKESLIKVYKNFTAIAAAICLLNMALFNNIILFTITFLSIFIYYIIINSRKNIDRGFKILVFIILLFNIYISPHVLYRILLGNTYTNYIMANVISIVIYSLVALFYHDDDTRFNLSLFSVCIPIMTLMNEVDIYWINRIMPSIMIYYLTFIVLRLLRKNKKIKEIASYIGFSLSFLIVLFTDNYCVLGYSFVLLVISLIIGYYNKSSNSLFRVAVIAFIIEILYQLRIFWQLIPAWLYLLIFGLTLIVFATYKQLKMNEKQKHDKK